MGLTVHYDVQMLSGDSRQAKSVVEKMRQLALDLPFEAVGEIQSLRGKQCDFEKKRKELEGDSLGPLWMLIQSGRWIRPPWNKELMIKIPAQRMFGFTVTVAPGSEPANIGLCQYPETFPFRYDPKQDKRFLYSIKNGGGKTGFCWLKWKRWRDKNPGSPDSIIDMEKVIDVPTNAYGWRWRSFCKTQYASDPSFGGLPNFLRSHISLITWLDRIGDLPGVKVTTDDEGHYGAHTHCPDWQEADAERRKRVYRRFKGEYNAKKLAESVGDWNQMIAGLAGAIKNAAFGTVEAPILNFQNFEELEFRGKNKGKVDHFLKGLGMAMAVSSKEQQ